MQKTVVRITCIIEESWIFQQMLVGFSTLARSRPWLLNFVNEHTDWPRQLPTFTHDAFVVSEKVAQQLRPAQLRGRPCVVLHGRHPAMPFVMADDEAVGVAAARHLLDCRLQHFAAYGLAGVPFWEKRLRSFADTLQRAGFTVDMQVAATQPPTSTRSAKNVRNRHESQIFDWIRHSPKPVGVFAGCDAWAAGLLFSANRLNIRVPDDLAIVGADNIPFITELAFPPLSSVSIPWHTMGYRAALFMEQLLENKTPADPQCILPPGEVVSRRSSDLLAVEDPDVAAALHYIRNHADQPVRSADVLRHVPVYRKKLEKNFRHYVGCTMTDEIRRRHVERAKHLLEATDLPLFDVAIRSGFTSQAKFCVAFRRECQQTPLTYRNTHRAPHK